jgi:hypothetical protein
MTILESSNNFADQIECVSANTAVTGSAAVTSDDGFLITAHPDNSAVVWVFENASGKTRANGYPLGVGVTVFLGVSRLSQVKFESALASQKICWIKC